MIKVQNLSVSFSGNKVIDNLSIDFPPNQIFGIIGLNGAGKTTLFNCLSGNMKANTGEISFNGKSISNKDIAYLETVNFFYSKITGNEYLRIFKTTNESFDLDALQGLLRLPLDELIETYSTGMKKKLALLGILKQEKAIFLLDEPFNGLDMETNKMLEIIITILKEKGRSVFVSSHILDPLLTVCDTIYFLEDGRFTKSFTKKDFHKIEDELFKKMKKEAQEIVTKAI